LSPDTSETRIRTLEAQVARLEQRVEDLLDRLSDQFGAFDRNIPELAHTREQLAACIQKVAALDERLDEEQRVRDIKKSEEQRDRWMRVATTVAMVGTFLSSTTAVLALLL
jgi:uncharacterized coiled-coil protein SlyX